MTLYFTFYNHFVIDLFQIPTTTTNTVDSDYEPTIKRKFSTIPISIMDDSYILLAAFLYSPGVSDSDIGHYTTGIKVNDKWEIYDDLKQKAEEVSSNKEVIIHALLYLKR